MFKTQESAIRRNAPSIKANTTFKGADKSFKVYYHANAEGFSSPFWLDSGGGNWNSAKIEK